MLIPILHVFHIPVQIGDLNQTSLLSLNLAVRTISRLGAVLRPSWRRGQWSRTLEDRKPSFLKKVSWGLREVVQEEGSAWPWHWNCKCFWGLRAGDKVGNRGRVGGGGSSGARGRAGVRSECYKDPTETTFGVAGGMMSKWSSLRLLDPQVCLRTQDTPESGAVCPLE